MLDTAVSLLYRWPDAMNQPKILAIVGTLLALSIICCGLYRCCTGPSIQSVDGFLRSGRYINRQMRDEPYSSSDLDSKSWLKKARWLIRGDFSIYVFDTYGDGITVEVLHFNGRVKDIYLYANHDDRDAAQEISSIIRSEFPGLKCVFVTRP